MVPAPIARRGNTRLRYHAQAATERVA